MSNGKYKVLGVFVGEARALPNGQLSAMPKNPIETLQIKKHKLPGNEVVNTEHHGGDMRVIHHYSEINYQYLKTTFPDIAEKFTPGSFGENLYTAELTEQELFIGDIYKLGSAKIQLTVSRRPCSTLNYSYEDTRILDEVLATGYVGWYYRVLEEGEVQVGDNLEFLERPYPNLKISDLYQQGYGSLKFQNLDFLQECLNTGLMDKGWKSKLEKALES